MTRSDLSSSSQLHVDDGEKNRWKSRKNTLYSRYYDAKNFTFSLSTFPREYVRVQRALRVVKRRGMSLCLLSGSDENMEKCESYFLNELYLAGEIWASETFPNGFFSCDEIKRRQ